MIKKLFNAGSGFVEAYDYTFSGLALTQGCLFGCAYCYAPTIIHKSLTDFQQGGKEVQVEPDAWEAALQKHVPKTAGKTVYINVMTDPYQPKVAPYTRRMLEVMLEHMPRQLVIQTRSPLAAKDKDLMMQFQDIRVNFTIETNDETVRKAFSPGAPGLQVRWKALTALSEAGIPVCITCTPTLPFEKSERAVLAWCEHVNALPTLTHLVHQRLHNGYITQTPVEGREVARRAEYDWFFGAGDGYGYLLDYLQTQVRVPVMEGKAGFHPFAPLGHDPAGAQEEERVTL